MAVKKEEVLENLTVIKRNGKVMVICSKDKSHKQTQG